MGREVSLTARFALKAVGSEPSVRMKVTEMPRKGSPCSGA